MSSGTKLQYQVEILLGHGGTRSRRFARAKLARVRCIRWTLSTPLDVRLDGMNPSTSQLKDEERHVSTAKTNNEEHAMLNMLCSTELLLSIALA